MKLLHLKNKKKIICGNYETTGCSCNNIPEMHYFIFWQVNDVTMNVVTISKCIILIHLLIMHGNLMNLV